MIITFETNRGGYEAATLREMKKSIIDNSESQYDLISIDAILISRDNFEVKEICGKICEKIESDINFEIANSRYEALFDFD